MGAPDPELAEVVDDASEQPDAAPRLPPRPPGRPRAAALGRASTGFGGFVAQVLDTGLNWRDTMQMEMPGFRERVCHIRLDADEGGLNLSMDEDAVRGLMMRGAYAGESFAGFSFVTHRFTRYLMLMQMLEAELKRARDRFGFDRPDGDDARWFRDRLTATLDDERYPWTNANNAVWCAEARAATQDAPRPDRRVGLGGARQPRLRPPGPDPDPASGPQDRAAGVVCGSCGREDSNLQGLSPDGS